MSSDISGVLLQMVAPASCCADAAFFVCLLTHGASYNRLGSSQFTVLLQLVTDSATCAAAVWHAAT